MIIRVVSLTAGKADFELDQQPDFAGVVGRSRFLLPSILSLMEEKDVFVQAEAAYALGARTSFDRIAIRRLLTLSEIVAHLTANSDRMQTLAHSFGAIPALKKLLAQADAKFEPFSSPKIRATSSMLREVSSNQSHDSISSCTHPSRALSSHWRPSRRLSTPREQQRSNRHCSRMSSPVSQTNPRACVRPPASAAVHSRGQ